MNKMTRQCKSQLEQCARRSEVLLVRRSTRRQRTLIRKLVSARASLTKVRTS